MASVLTLNSAWTSHLHRLPFTMNTAWTAMLQVAALASLPLQVRRGPLGLFIECKEPKKFID